VWLSLPLVSVGRDERHGALKSEGAFLHPAIEAGSATSHWLSISDEYGFGSRAEVAVPQHTNENRTPSFGSVTSGLRLQVAAQPPFAMSNSPCPGTRALFAAVGLVRRERPLWSDSRI